MPIARKLTRLLRPLEVETNQYLLGYSKVQLFDIDQYNTSIRYLNEAIDHFKSITASNDPELRYLSKIAKEKLTNYIKSSKSRITKFGGALILVISIVVVLVAQFTFFIGRPIIGRDVIATISVAKGESPRILNLTDSSYAKLPNTFDLRDGDRVTEILTEISSIFDVGKENVQLSYGSKFRMLGLEQINSINYFALTFGGLVFIVLSFYLHEFTKLKMGSIEIEKTTEKKLPFNKVVKISGRH